MDIYEDRFTAVRDKFFQMRRAHEKQVAFVESAVNQIDFSIHGSCQASVEKYMEKRGSFNQMMEILKNLIQIRQEYDAGKLILERKYIV